MEVNLDVIYHPEKYRINGDVEDIDTIIADKAEFITSFCEVIMKKPQNAELNGDEVSMIDLCVKDIYKKYLYNDPKPENMPTLQDFYERLNFYAPDKPAAQIYLPVIHRKYEMPVQWKSDGIIPASVSLRCAGFRLFHNQDLPESSLLPAS